MYNKCTDNLLYCGWYFHPKSVVISPADFVEPVCEPDRVANEIACNNLDVYCQAPDDEIVLRIVAAGEILMWDGYCAEVVAEGFNYFLK